MHSHSQAFPFHHRSASQSHLAPREQTPVEARRPLRLWLDYAAIPDKTSLRLHRGTSFARWSEIGMQLAIVAETTAWWLGDWLVYGQDNYEGRYKDAVEKTSLDYQTLRNYAWVARAFSVSRRRDMLSFAHHAEVAGLSAAEQDFWLRKAETGQWSRNRLRAEVRASLSERNTSPGPEAGDVGEREKAQGMVPYQAPHTLALRLSDEQLERFRRAAGAQRRTLEEWVIWVLEQVSGIPSRGTAAPLEG